MRWLALLWPLAFVLAYALDLQRYVTWQALAANQQWLQELVTLRPVAAAVCFMIGYAAMVAVSLPVGEVVTVAGGLLFGTAAGAAYSVVGATVGAILLFLAARSMLGARLERRGGKLMERLRAGLERDGFSYLLAIRLVPLVPFWVANLAPALAGMRLAPFAAATLIGIIPATVVFASLGAGVGAVLAQGGAPDFSVILRPAVVLPLVGLAALSLVPVAYRRWR